MTDSAITQTDHLWIPLPCGTRLAARMWQPSDINTPLPAILEYLPYRKGDGTAIPDAARYQYIAARGFACLRVDIRGTGDSEGLFVDEYSEQELIDGYELIEWIAKQAWCNGRVGLTGISWGGFNALQLAAMNPPALCAIATACSTDNRYTDDVHYVGGHVLAADMPGWAATLMSIVSKPPDPKTSGPAWYETWQQRLRHLPDVLTTWLAHPDYDQYWQHGSVCEQYANVKCPTLLVGGWADGYTNAVLRLLENLPSQQTCAIIGPWSHGWPDNTRPGPSFDYLEEVISWWRLHLSTPPTATASLPALRCYFQDFELPDRARKSRTGKWYAIPAWPTGESTVTYQYSGERDLLVRQADSATTDPAPVSAQELLHIPADLAHGKAGGVWCPFGSLDQLPGNQAEDDAMCLVTDSAPFKSDLFLLGQPEVSCKVEHEMNELEPAKAQIVVRLCEVNPAGDSLLLARGVSTPGTGHLTLKLDAIGHRVSQGNRLRLAFSCSYWPMVWPPASLQDISINQQISLCLPTINQAKLNPIDMPPGQRLANGLVFEVLSSPAAHRDVSSSMPNTENAHASALTEVHEVTDSGHLRLPGGMETTGHSENHLQLSVTESGEIRPEVTCHRISRLQRADWRAETEVSIRMTSDAETFITTTELIARLNDEVVFEQSWQSNQARGNC